MIKINILTDTVGEHRYIGDELEYEDFNNLRIYENSSLNIVWDVVVVYEGLVSQTSFRVRKGGLWFISGEPPLSREYPRKFLKLFDLQITSHHYMGLNNVVHDQQSLDWWYCKSYRTKKHSLSIHELASMNIPEKPRKISIISSSKRMMPGHNLRQRIIHRLKTDFPNQIDFYGGDAGNVEYKKDAIDPYMFCICIENSSINDYWTEKLADPLLGYCVPIYSGCTNINKYFDLEGMFFFDVKDYQGLKRIIQKILKNPDEEYSRKFESLLHNRNLLINQYHIFSLIQKYICVVSLGDPSIVTIKPMNDYFSYRINLLRLRLLRFFYKIYFSFVH